MHHTGNNAGNPRALRLDMLPKGQSATVVELESGTDERVQARVLRLMEIGFLPGESVRVLAQGFPAADPLAVRVGQATFALRRREAALVLVDTHAPSHAQEVGV